MGRKQFVSRIEGGQFQAVVLTRKESLEDRLLLHRGGCPGCTAAIFSEKGVWSICSLHAQIKVEWVIPNRFDRKECERDHEAPLPNSIPNE
jgi:hypothetical protein